MKIWSPNPLTRREFSRRFALGLTGVALTGLPAASRGLWAANSCRSEQDQEEEEWPVLCRAETINGERLWQSLRDLSRFGKLPAGGTTRLGFSNEDLAARNWVIEQLVAEGLEVSVDAAANIRARRAGDDSGLPALMFGSHIDTVPRGGDYDGCVGSMSALEVMRTLNEKEVRTKHPLELIIFSNEEGTHYGQGLFGSRALAGLLDPSVLDAVDEEGVTLGEWVRRMGGDPDLIGKMKPREGAVHAYLELHIEQGATLAQRNFPIGIVQGIVGIHEFMGVVEGVANHAGTTPMDQRQDALLTAAKIVQAVREIVTAEPGRQVGTVGYIKAEPGAPNVIPKRAEFTIELRDLDMEKIDGLADKIRVRGRQLARADGTTFRMEHIASYEPAITNRVIRFHIQRAAEEMRASALVMPSGAGHDAQYMARITPVGMIFVPSRGGISHAPEEFTRKENVACGCEALYRTILRLDKVRRISGV